MSGYSSVDSAFDRSAAFQWASMSSPGDNIVVSTNDGDVDGESDASRFGARVSWPRSNLKQRVLCLLPLILRVRQGRWRLRKSGQAYVSVFANLVGIDPTSSASGTVFAYLPAQHRK
jgi:hypothetical protein